jgi:2'-5' RNA ligase
MHDEIAAIYDMLWNTGFDPVSRGDVEIDPYISNPGSDRRRGLTLIFRPPSAVKSKILDFLAEIQALEPDQYYYTAANLHFTVLSLFTAITDHRPEYERLPAYESAAQKAVLSCQPFSMRLAGLTVSKSAVMLCGFPEDDRLNELRGNLRRHLIQGGLSQGLDRRYILVGAHTTVMRFAAPLKSPAAFSQFLLENKHRPFGTFQVDELQLVKNDWYMSQQNTPVVAQYNLKDN